MHRTSASSVVSMSRESEPSSPDSAAAAAPAGWVPQTAADREAVREQLGRILSTALFRNSKRFPVFLQHTVEHALTSSEPLKERTIGHEVFARDPGYDTGQDPVVRMTAAEVRKRLAQYYQQPEHQSELIVAFQPGSYVPEFIRPVRRQAEVEAPAVEVQPLPAPGWPLQRRAVVALAVAAVVVAAVAALVFGVMAARKPHVIGENAASRFWSPLVDASSPVLICIGDPSPQRNQAEPGQAAEGPEALTVPEFLRANSVRYTDAVTVALLAGELRSRGKAFRIRRPSATEFKDLRDGPVVLVGGFNNPWTLKLTEGMRFTLATDAGTPFIRDRQHPDSRQWQSEGSDRLLRNVNQAYGLITRAHDPATGQTVLTVSGLVLGTAAAGECLLDADCLDSAERLAAGGPDKRNLQVVVSAPVIGLDTGAPRVVAAHAW